MILEFDEKRYANEIVKELKSRDENEIYEEEILDKCIPITDRWSSENLLSALEAECIEKLENMGIKIKY